MSEVKKHLCSKCEKMAVYLYLPSSDNENPYYCDDCVPRGCSCNHYYTNADAYSPEGGIFPQETDYPIKWISETEWCSVDEEGREYPCCEYHFDEEGYEIDNE